MQETKTFLRNYRQNNKLAVRLIAPDFGHLSHDVLVHYGASHRKPHYFIILMLEGSATYGIDLNPVEVKNNELLFILPNQIHQLPASKQATGYFKIGFDDDCLSLLPRQYPFLINPFSDQKIKLNEDVVERLNSIFKILLKLLSDMNTDADLILAHLNSLLTEINAAYFVSDRNHAEENLVLFGRFKNFVEANLVEQPTVQKIATELAVNTNSLYHFVKQFSGISPKEYITNRLILEAKRRLYYAESSSIKNLAFDLGFNDPEYFSRLFKKVTGQTISGFIQDSSGN